jgi:1-acyl-sn-glycerol-3-phosphate acyltransferase
MTELASMREQVYTDPRPKEHFDRFHERARTREPDWAYELVRIVTSLYAYTLLRARSITPAFITAETLLGRGSAVAMYCEGGRSRTGRMADKAKRGIGRLALQTGAPVVPIAIHGSSHIRNWKRLQFPRVTIHYGDPVRFERIAEPTREQQQAVADHILGLIKDLYGGLEQHGRKGVLERLREKRRTERAPSPPGAATA